MAGDRQHSLAQQTVAQRGIAHGRGSRAHGNWAGVRGTRDWDRPVMPDAEKGRRGVQNGRRGVQGGRGHAHGATKVHNRRPGRSTTATGANCPMKQEEAHCRVRAWEKPTAPDTGEWGRYVGRGKFVSVGERGRHKGRPGGSGKGRPGGSRKQATVQNILVQICDVQKLAKQNEPDNDNLSTKPYARVAGGLKSKVLGAGPPDPLPDDDEAGRVLQVTVRAAQCVPSSTLG